MCREMEQPSKEGIFVVVTFDHGHRDLYPHVLPALKRYQIPAPVFLAGVVHRDGASALV